MASINFPVILLALGLVCVVHGFHDWNGQLNEVDDPAGSEAQFLELDIISVDGQDGRTDGQDRPHPRPPGPRPGPGPKPPGPRPGPGPGPGPRQPPFFVGTYLSDPSRDWQINMFQVYNATGFPAEYLNAVMVINITDLGNDSFQFMESANNDTFYNITFQLGKPIVINGTNSSKDEELTFRTTGSTLRVSSNSSSLGLSQADLQFDVRGHSNGVDVVYQILNPNITGTRHFRRVGQRPYWNLMASADGSENQSDYNRPGQYDAANKYDVPEEN